MCPLETRGVGGALANPRLPPNGVLRTTVVQLDNPLKGGPKGVTPNGGGGGSEYQGRPHGSEGKTRIRPLRGLLEGVPPLGVNRGVRLQG